MSHFLLCQFAATKKFVALGMVENAATSACSDRCRHRWLSTATVGARDVIIDHIQSAERSRSTLQLIDGGAPPSATHVPLCPSVCLSVCVESSGLAGHH